MSGATCRGVSYYYYYSTLAGTWIRLADNYNDNVWQTGGALGVQLRDKTDAVEIMDNYTGTQIVLFRHYVGVGAYPTDVKSVSEGRLQITGYGSADQLSLRHPASVNLKWGLFVSAFDSSLSFYSNGSLRSKINRVTGVYTDHRTIGFMAQDVLPYFPELVYQSYDRETGKPFYMMNYDGFGVVQSKPSRSSK